MTFDLRSIEPHDASPVNIICLELVITLPGAHSVALTLTTIASLDSLLDA